MLHNSQHAEAENPINRFAYPSTTLSDGIMMDRMSIHVKAMDKKIAARRMPNRGDLLISWSTGNL
jgi:hypothetical protein